MANSCLSHLETFFFFTKTCCSGHITYSFVNFTWFVLLNHQKFYDKFLYKSGAFWFSAILHRNYSFINHISLSLSLSIYIYIYMRTRAPVCVCVCVRAGKRVCVYTRALMCVCVCVREWEFMHIHREEENTCICMCLCLKRKKDIYIYIYISSWTLLLCNMIKLTIFELIFCMHSNFQNHCPTKRKSKKKCIINNLQLFKCSITIQEIAPRRITTLTE